MNTDNFLIEEKDLELAQEICKSIQDGNVRNRAVANAIAANIASKFFESANVDFESGLHNISDVLNDIDIADIYINNAYIDVRVFFDEEEFGVPKAHFDNNLTPAAYMFIKISEDLYGATVVGFILPENIDTTKEASGYYPVEYDTLVSFYDIESHLIAEEDTYAVEDKDIFAYLDGTIAEKNQFYRNLIASKDGRLRLAKAAKAQYVFNFVSVAESDVEPQAEESQLLEPVEEDFGLMEAAPLDLIEEKAPLELDNSLDEPIETEDLLEQDSEEIIGFEDVEPIDEIQPLEDNNLLEEAGDISLDFGEADEAIEEPEAEEEPDLDEPAFEASAFDVDSITFVNDNPEEAFPVSPEPVNIEPEAEPEDDFASLIQEETPEPVVDLPAPQEEAIIEEVEESKSQEEVDGNSFEDFKTVTSPSLDVYEELENLDETLDTASAAMPDNSQEAGEQTEEIEALFNNPDEQASIPAGKKSGSSLKLLLIVGFLAVLGALGFLGYTKFTGAEDAGNNLVQEAEPIPTPDIPQEPKVQQDAMPVETVEAAKPELNKDEGIAESIPAIEQNLDASILVSNLKVDWEVPAGYANNTSAKRYLIKLGKIVQLNLKTELLLLSKPPITNKIAVEIKFNPTSRKFETVGITTSSGEQTVDDLILRTVQKALAMNLSMNADSFTNLKGNPTLIIRL